jgi:hypothetical protein
VAVTYINRKEDKYYLHNGTTKKGNPKYYFSKKSGNNLADKIPQGFEIYEKPFNGQVLLRKIIPNKISEIEQFVVEKGIRVYAKLDYFIMDIKSNILTIFLPDVNNNNVDNSWMRIQAYYTNLTFDKFKEKILKESNYSALMRFILKDEEKRTFVVERYCFLGSIDDWIFLEQSDNLKKLVMKYCRHLGRDSFYDL